jgi:hypothetical protein
MARGAKNMMLSMRLSRVLLYLACILLLGEGISCERREGRDETVGGGDDTASQSELPVVESAEEFRYASGINNMMNGIDYIVIENDGDGLHVFASGIEADRDGAEGYETYRRSSFSVDNAGVDTLKRTLDAVRFFAMKNAYHDVNIADGTQRYLSVTADGTSKTVYFNNSFPEGARRVFEVQDSILEGVELTSNSVPVSYQYLRENRPF